MRKFQQLDKYEHKDVDSALARGDVEELQRVVIAVALEDADYAYAEQLCTRLARHPDATVRGNALLGFGHLARRFGQMSSEGRRLVDEGLRDDDAHVRGQSESAADDIAMFAR